jgi:hypothetical protein
MSCPRAAQRRSCAALKVDPLSEPSGGHCCYGSEVMELLFSLWRVRLTPLSSGGGDDARAGGFTGFAAVRRIAVCWWDATANEQP